MSQFKHLITCTLLALFGLSGSSPDNRASEPESSPSAQAEEASPSAAEPAKVDTETSVTEGSLRFLDADGATVVCPLKHTDVQADVSGFIARVNVTQTFHNPTKGKIEAVYVFPLPAEGAVDNMSMLIGDRKVVGLIKRREEARAIYENALLQGQRAALLEQERPNIFTQSVGNIGPGEEVKIEISYVDVLKYDAGNYEFRFPMVVGPRYIPGQKISSTPSVNDELAGRVVPPTANTDRVPDASRINPPVLHPGTRNGHDISLTISLNAGVPIQNLKVANHKADVEHTAGPAASVKLSPADSLPNKDFVLRYDVVGPKPAMALLTHTGSYTDSPAHGDGYFMLMVQPQEDERLTKSPPREIVFLVDVSGSMSGEPTNKSIELMNNMLGHCREQDTVQVITFASSASKLFEKPVPVTRENIAKTLAFTDGLKGGGGTEMLKGIQAAIDEPIDNERLRIVIMLTDGYIGNEAEIIEHVGKHCGDQIRFWAVGVGSSPNTMLIEGVARQGSGMGKNLGLQDDSAALGQEIITRIQRAQLAKVNIDWGVLKVSETYPAKIPELWAGRPIILFGRYSGDGQTTVTVRGSVEGEPAQWPINVNLPAEESKNDVLAKVWARQKIEDLMQQDFYGNSPAIEETVTALALDYKLMSQYTSFVAVDADEVEKLADGPARLPRRMLVPVPIPEGTQFEGFFGQARAADSLTALSEGTHAFGLAAPAPAAAPVQHSYRQTRGATAAKATSLDALAKRVRRMPSTRSQSAAAGRVVRFSESESLEFRGVHDPYSMRSDYSAGHYFMFLDSDFGPSDRASLNLATAVDQPSEPLVTAAKQRIADATKLEELSGEAATTDPAMAQAAYTAAYLLDLAAQNFGAPSTEIGDKALAAIQRLQTERSTLYQERLPALASKLELVIRDASLEDALQSVANAAGVQIHVVPGSIDDAAALNAPEQVRVSFLDLRGATAAQALDWLLLPAKLNWTVEEGRVVAASDRRRDGRSAWIYDVSMIASPRAEELGDANAPEKMATEAQRLGEQFLSVARNQSALTNDDSLVWFAPGQLLLVADTKVHHQLTELLSNLANPNAKLAGPAADLHTLTIARAEARSEQHAKQQRASELRRIAARHRTYAWQLLATAAAGELDLEALTELQIAWKSDATQELLDDAPAVAMHSWWALTEAVRALPEERELQELAAQARKTMLQQLDEVLEAAQKDEPNSNKYFTNRLALLYGLLASGEDESEQARAVQKLLTSPPQDAAAGVSLAQLVRAILGDADAARELIQIGPQGDDFVALTALAARRVGGPTWTDFRANQRNFVQVQPLDSNVVLLINRLASASTTLAAR